MFFLVYGGFRFSCMYCEYKYFFIDDGLNIDVWMLIYVFNC